MLQSQPASLTLRYLQTLTEIAAENNTTTIFPIPIDFFRTFFQRPDDALAAPHPVTAPAASEVPAEPVTGTLSGLDPAEQLRRLRAAVQAGPGAETKSE
jgi:hypothetical protein